MFANSDSNSNYCVEVYETISLKLNQLKSLLMIGQDTDFSNYKPETQEDFFGSIIDCLHELDLSILNYSVGNMEKQ